MSTLTTATLRKFLRESFVGANPLVVKSEDIAELAGRIRQMLTPFDCVEVRSDRYAQRDSKLQHVATLAIRPPDRRYYYYANEFHIVVNPADQLQITNYRQGADVCSLDELVAFVQRCRDRFLRQNVQAAKRTKVRGLQQQAALVQLKAIAKEDKFDFILDERHHTLDVLVRLEDDVAIEVKLSYKEFHRQLPELRATIADLRRVYDRGIKYKVFGLTRYYQEKWIRHETL